MRFSPTAWAKLLYLRDAGDTEVGGFGISSDDDLLLVEDVCLVKQVCSWAHVAFDDEAVADFFDDQVDAGRRPEQFGRIWLHTHPGDCPEPSLVDEETFSRVFGRADWAVMFIIARGGQSYARLRFNSGPGAELEIAVGVEYSCSFSASDHKSWGQEYQAKVRSQENLNSCGPDLEVHELALTGLADAASWTEPWLSSSDAHLTWEDFVYDDS